MTRWHVDVSGEAAKVVRRQERRLQKRLLDAMTGLESSPYPGPGRDIKPVKGAPGTYRLRVGDWRVLYTVNEEARAVYVAAIRPRGQAYRGL